MWQGSPKEIITAYFIWAPCYNFFYYMGNSVLLENKPLIESKWQYIRVPRRIFSISSLVKIFRNFKKS